MLCRLATSTFRSIGRHPSQITRNLSITSARPDSFHVQDEDDFKARVIESPKPIVVDFSATWCGPCKILTPRLDAAIAATDGAVDLAIVDIDDLSDLAIDYGVNAVPTVLGMKNGEIVAQFVGLADEDKLGAFMAKIQDS